MLTKKLRAVELPPYVYQAAGRVLGYGAWWMRVLWSMLPRSVRTQISARPRRVLIYPAPEGPRLSVEHWNGRDVPIEIPSDELTLWARPETPCALVVDSDTAYRHSEILPAMSPSRTASALQLRLASVSPVKPETVLPLYRQIDERERRQRISLYFAPRSLVEPAISAAAEFGWTVSELLVREGAELRRAVSLDANVASVSRYPPRQTLLLGTFCVLALFVLASSFSDRLDRRQGLLEARLAELRLATKQVQARNTALDATAQTLQSVAARSFEPKAAKSLSNIAKRMPVDVFLHQITLEKARVTLAGLAENGSRLQQQFAKNDTEGTSLRLSTPKAPYGALSPFTAELELVE